MPVELVPKQIEVSPGKVGQGRIVVPVLGESFKKLVFSKQQILPNSKRADLKDTRERRRVRERLLGDADQIDCVFLDKLLFPTGIK